jgi:mannose-6-phosphate isomerase class I
MPRNSNYDKYPCIAVSSSRSECSTGWPQIIQQLKQSSSRDKCVACVECYPGAFERTITEALAAGFRPSAEIFTPDLLKSAPEIDKMLQGLLGDDPVFGRMSTIRLEDFFDERKLAKARETVRNWKQGLLLVVGTGAALVSPEPDLLVYADMARWEIQSRQRQNLIANLGADNLEESASAKYKRAFFVDWRAADQLKKELLPKIDFLLDTNADVPKLITGRTLLDALHKVAHHPFRVVPYFDPGPWGGHWMEEVCDLPKDAPNHAWCFDCVPEENSLLLGFGDACVEIPAIDLTFLHPRELLGEEICSRFGAEFPIRFDLLDTMGGGNLSLQVHPKTEYIRREFGMNYTQDESYYLLDASADGSVYLGVKPNVDAEAMIRDLRSAQEGGPQFKATEYVNQFPARKHDHFLIPAGTVHCSGKNSMVLEISATPYIFTFKLWDWERLGLDGLPRPIHIDRGQENIVWSRDTTWVRRNLINRIEPINEGPGWREERTGLHELQFIETRRHWFTGVTPHDTNGTVNVVNLVEGMEATVESPNGSFDPFVVHYAETFIVPASVGEYTIRPSGESLGQQCGTIKAFVRNR